MTPAALDAAGMNETTRPLTVYYDGACPLCRREIAFISSRMKDGDAAFLDISDGAGEKLGPDLDRETALKRFHIRLSNGTLLSGASAFAEIWKKTPGLGWLGHLVSQPSLTPSFDWLYSRFLIVRPWFQRLLNRL